MGTLNHGLGPLFCCFITLFGAGGTLDPLAPPSAPWRPPGRMFANSGRARAHSHGHAHDCRHGHAHGYYHGHKKYIIGIAYGYSHGHAHYILAVPMILSMGTLEIQNFVYMYYTSRMGSYHYIVRPIVDNH